MSSVNHIAGNSQVQQIVAKPVQKSVAPAEAPATQKSADKVELSGVSHLLDALKSNDVRADKVAEIRAQIAAGTYETDAKLDMAADRLLDDLLK